MLNLIISEIDGVVTDGTIAIDPMGHTIFKQYYTNDFGAINELKKYFKFVFISSDSAVNYAICRNKNIPFYHSKNKLEDISTIMHRYQAGPDNVLYVASTFSDLDCIKLIPLSVCPSDGAFVLKDKVTNVLNAKGGSGVICELYDLLSSKIKEIKTC